MRTVRFLNTPKGSKRAPDGIHSERRLIKWVKLMEEREKPVKVNRVFSDRIPCGPDNANCARVLGDAFGRDRKTFFNIRHGRL